MFAINPRDYTYLIKSEFKVYLLQMMLNQSITRLNQSISENEIDMMLKKYDRRLFNDEVKEVIDMLNIPNQKYRSFRLNKRLNIKYKKSIHFVKDVLEANTNIFNYVQNSKLRPTMR